MVLCLSISIAASPTVSAQGAILIETKTNTILYEHNAYTKLYPASITKLMTALLITEQLPDGTKITKSQNSVDVVPHDSSNIGLQVGDTFDKTNALYGLLLGSDNYIAHDLALAHSGTIKKFAAQMNARAYMIGCQNTHFVNPHGYHDPNHYTTPYDMALIAKEAFSNPIVQKIAGTASYNFYIANKNSYLPITNSSRLLKSQTDYYNPHVVACKTGFHDDAGQTLVAKAVYADMELIAVVMNEKTPNQYIDVNNLFEYANANFSITDMGNYYGLNNLTVPKWVQKSAAHGVKAGWLNAAQDYNDTLYVEDLVIMLKKACGTSGGITMTSVQNLTGLKAGDTLTLSQLRQIIYYASTNMKKSMPSFNQSNLSTKATFAEAISIIDRLVS